ncbi:PKD domain-containing protein [Kordia sp.]|uniref:PKD domain-containing protein n=1 Tax=Kordia sp. TaxID=1965332 RepID=UPI003D2DBC15
MCQISFTIQYADADGDTLQAAEGRYRVASSTGAWTPFTIDINDPKTPDITVIEEYTLEVRVQDTGNLWSNWFASSFKVSRNCTQTNQPPTVNAGVDQNISSNNTSVTAIASDPDGTIVSYSWELVGSLDTTISTSNSIDSSIRITNPNSATTAITGLTQGSHTFRCTVTDNNGATAFDDVVILYLEQIINNTLFNVTKSSRNHFKIESSQYINQASFTLVFETLEYDSANGVRQSDDEIFNLSGVYNLSNTTNQNTIINIIKQNANIVDTAVSWSEIGGVYSIVFETVYTSTGIIPEENAVEYYLERVKNVSAT